MKIARLAPVLSFLALALLLIGGPGYRLGLWGLSFGLLDLMRYALFAGTAGAVLGVVFLLIPRLRRGHALGLLSAVVVGGVVAAVPVTVRTLAEEHPIHDITTDLDDPPRFEAIAPLRDQAPNPAAYAGAETARAQREHYPDLDALTSPLPPGRVFDAALAVARDRGWNIVAADADRRRIEAVDTTFWYGFRDDIVIRVETPNGGARLDVRSKSRVGRSDLGKNAERIRDYLGDVRRRLESG